MWKMNSNKIFSSWWITQYSERTIYHAYNNRSKKKLFSPRTKLSYNRFFSEKLLTIEMNETQTFRNKSVYLPQWILEISEIVMYRFCYDYVKSKYGEKARIC